MKNVCVLMLAVLCACIALADSLDEVSFSWIKDFGGKNGRIAMYWRDAMFKRREGVYCATLQSDGVSFFRAKGLRKLYVGVVSTNRVAMFFEDSSGQMLSCVELMHGKLTDESFYWGPPKDGVAAWYGVVNDTLVLTISPHGTFSCFVLKRTSKEFDEQSIHMVQASGDSGFLGIPSPDRRRQTVVRKVCGGECCVKAVEDGVTKHRCKHGAGEETAACYVFSFGGKHIKGLSEWDDGGWTDLYMLLRYDGKLVFILGKGGENFSMWWPPDHAWTEWFSCNRPNVAWQVSHDVIVENCVYFGPSSSIDDYLRYPADFDKWGGMHPENPRPELDRRAVEYCSGGYQKFWQRVFVRLEASDSNAKLVRKLEAVQWTPPVRWAQRVKTPLYKGTN